MPKLLEPTFQRNLDALDLTQIAHQTGIENGYTKKVHARPLLTSLLLLINQRQTSLRAWASLYSLLTGTTVSKQALALKFDDRHRAFFQAVAQRHLQQRLTQHQQPLPRFAAFTRVLVEDSTCFSLPDHLHDGFPTSYAGGQPKATMRLQWLHDLQHERLVAFDLQRYRDNDQKHAPAIVRHLQPGDLVLRDLGYFATAVFGAIAQQGAYYLSRLHYRVQVCDAQQGHALDLVAHAEQAAQRQQGYLDLPVRLGKQHQLPVRLIGIRLPEATVAVRRRRARKAAQRDRRRGYSARYAAWLSWSFFVTNVPSTHLDTAALVQYYRLRWRIEILFKGLKQGMQVGALFLVRGLSPARLRISLLGVMLYAMLVAGPLYRLISQAKGAISWLKLLQWLQMHLIWVLLTDTPSWVEQAAYACRYERRRRRLNYDQWCQATAFP